MKLSITQKELTNANLESVGNRIKLRKASLEKFKSEVKSIPYQKVEDNYVQSEEINNDKKYEVLEVSGLQLVNGAQRPISVKENMFAKLKKCGTSIKESEEKSEISIAKDETVVEEKKETVVRKEEPEVKKKEDVKEVDKTDKKENKNMGNPKIVNIDKSFEEINNVRQHVLDVKEQADKAQREAVESDEKLQKLGMECTETEKLLQEAELKNEAVRNEIIKAINRQNSTLAIAKKQYEELIGIANEKKAANQKKIDAMQTKIDKTTEKLSSVTNDTARQEEILLALNGFDDNVVPFYVDTNNYEEENIRRIA